MKVSVAIISITSFFLLVQCSPENNTVLSSEENNPYSKDTTIIQDSLLCPLVNENDYRTIIVPVKTFKDSLTLTINCNKSHYGTQTFPDSVYYKGKFKDESPIIKLSQKVGLRVSIGRIISNGNNFYIYSIHLYGNDGNCWKDLNENSGWNPFNLGPITKGVSFGYYGTSEAIGFNGEMKIE